MTALAIGSQVLARIKAEASQIAQRAAAPALVFGPVGLGGIFNDQQLCRPQWKEWDPYQRVDRKDGPG